MPRVLCKCGGAPPSASALGLRANNDSCWIASSCLTVSLVWKLLWHRLLQSGTWSTHCGSGFLWSKKVPAEVHLHCGESLRAHMQRAWHALQHLGLHKLESSK